MAAIASPSCHPDDHPMHQRAIVVDHREEALPRRTTTKSGTTTMMLDVGVPAPVTIPAARSGRAGAGRNG
jgi:hypothetical protein